MKNKNNKFYISLFFCFIFGLFFAFTSAYGAGLVSCGETTADPCTFDDFFELIRDVLDFIWLFLVPAFAVLWFGFGGYKMILSQGDPSKYTEGKNMIIYGAVGIAVIYTAPVIIKAFLTLLGAKDWVTTFFK